MRALRSEATHCLAKGIEYGDLIFYYYEDPAFLECQQAKCCSPSFSKSKVHYLFNSLSTEGSLPPMCTLRYSKAYAGPRRKKDRSRSQKVWFCCMIMQVHTCPASDTRNGPSLSRSSFTAWLCSPFVSMWLVF